MRQGISKIFQCTKIHPYVYDGWIYCKHNHSDSSTGKLFLLVGTWPTIFSSCSVFMPVSPLCFCTLSAPIPLYCGMAGSVSVPRRAGRFGMGAAPWADLPPPLTCSSSPSVNSPAASHPLVSAWSTGFFSFSVFMMAVSFPLLLTPCPWGGFRAVCRVGF